MNKEFAKVALAMFVMFGNVSVQHNDGDFYEDDVDYQVADSQLNQGSGWEVGFSFNAAHADVLADACAESEGAGLICENIPVDIWGAGVNIVYLSEDRFFGGGGDESYSRLMYEEYIMDTYQNDCIDVAQVKKNICVYNAQGDDEVAACNAALVTERNWCYDTYQFSL